MFYPAAASELGRELDALLAGAPRVELARPPKGVIAPHAGYVYSGPIAASAYAQLRPRAPDIERVVVLGPAHRVYLEGLALPEATRMQTPLGSLEVDAQLRERLLAMPQVCASAEVHAREHSLEVHFPFIQTLFPRARVVPLVVGDAPPDQVAQVLAHCWGGPETAIVISSDLSHFHAYEEAARLDRATAEWIASSERPGLDPRRACGARGIDGLLALRSERALRLELLDLRNSGDTAGRRDRVVGYAAFAIHEGPA